MVAFQSLLSHAAISDRFHLTTVNVTRVLLLRFHNYKKRYHLKKVIRNLKITLQNVKGVLT